MNLRALPACVLILVLSACEGATIDPVAWNPPEPPALEGPTAVNEVLREAETLGKDVFSGAEDIAPSADGWLYGGNEDGAIVRLSLVDPPKHEVVAANKGGRPLGLDFDPGGNLVVADAKKGLLRVTPEGKVETLATQAAGVPFAFTDDVDVARDGTIYFSDASSKWGIDDYMLDALEGRAWGRLLRYDPFTKKTDVLLDGLYFANGVALSPNEDFVLVNETYRFRVTRYWLKGEKAGTHEVFLDDLPGYPDGISSDGRGTFWIAIVTVRNREADSLAPKPTLRKLVALLPRSLWPEPEPYGLVLGASESGEILYSLHDPGGVNVRMVTSVEATEDALYLGTLHGAGVWRYPLPIGTSPRTTEEVTPK